MCVCLLVSDSNWGAFDASRASQLLSDTYNCYVFVFMHVCVRVGVCVCECMCVCILIQ